MDNEISIRSVTVDDAAAIQCIYSYYVRETAITFEIEVPSVDEMARRIEATLAKYPYLVAIEPDGKIVGYAYAGQLKERAAYAHSVELSVYVENGGQHRGVGGALYRALEKELERLGILNMYACIAYPQHENPYLTTNSVEFHNHMGFEQVGRFHSCASKFGLWFDVVWMEKFIGPHGQRGEGK